MAERRNFFLRARRKVSRFFEGDPPVSSPIDIPEPVRRLAAKSSRETKRRLDQYFAAHPELKLSTLDDIIIGDYAMRELTLDKIKEANFSEEDESTYMTATMTLFLDNVKKHRNQLSTESMPASVFKHYSATAELIARQILYPEKFEYKTIPDLVEDLQILAESSYLSPLNLLWFP